MQKYIIPILVFFCVGCTNQQNKDSRYTEEQISSLHLDSTTILTENIDSVVIIDFNSFLKKQHFDFGSLVKEVKLIPLETTNESLIDDIYKVLIIDSHIYIYDKYKGGGLVVFNKDGKFVRRITHGQGPGEIFRLLDVAYDMEQNELVAYQHPFLYYFKPSGEFIRTMKLPFGFYNFTITRDGYVFKTIDRQGNGHLGPFENYTLFVTDKDFKLKSVGMPCLPMGRVLGGYNYLYNNNSINITQGYCDTIYQYMAEANSLKAKYIIDYNKKKLPEHYLYDENGEFDNVIRQNDYYFYIGEYLDTETHHSFSLCNWHIELNTIIYRDKKSGHLIGGTNADYNTNETPSIAFPRWVSGNYFISTYLPGKNDFFATKSSIISENDKLKVKNLTEDDNPVLVLFTLKDF